jgi:predicted phosphoribosyltransferase
MNKTRKKIRNAARGEICGGKRMKARLHEINELRNRQYVFKNRINAGRTLSLMLEPLYKEAGDCMVLAIPSGGVPVAIEVSETLQLPLDLLIVRKLQIPGNPEAGFGAMTRDGTVFLNEPLLMELRLSEAEIEEQKQKVLYELEARNDLFRGGKPFPDLEGMSVIIIDDGLASGYTMMASIHDVRRRNAAKTIVAVPTAPVRTISRIEDMADEIYCPNVRDEVFFSVAGAYEDWYDLDHREVMRLIHEQGSS